MIPANREYFFIAPHLKIEDAVIKINQMGYRVISSVIIDPNIILVAIRIFNQNRL